MLEQTGVAGSLPNRVTLSSMASSMNDNNKSVFTAPKKRAVIYWSCL
jgi:hypothetical protein